MEGKLRLFRNAPVTGIRRRTFSTLTILIAAMAITASFPAHSATVTDLNLADQNAITSVVESSTDTITIIQESYGEDRRIPYESHDGYGIANQAGEFFDKLVTITTYDLEEPDILYLMFHVSNDTPYDWSDYHFLVDNLIGWDVAIFSEEGTLTIENQLYEDGELKLWAPEWIEVGDTLYALLGIDISGMEEGDSFSITQIATTVPEPATLLLLGSGLAGLACFGRRSKRH